MTKPEKKDPNFKKIFMDPQQEEEERGVERKERKKERGGTVRVVADPVHFRPDPENLIFLTGSRYSCTYQELIQACKFFSYHSSDICMLIFLT